MISSPADLEHQASKKLQEAMNAQEVQNLAAQVQADYRAALEDRDTDAAPETERPETEKPEAEKTEAGCRLSITSLPSKSADERSVKQLVKSPPLPAVFASENREALDRAARLLGPDAVTALYHTRDRWFLLVNGGCGEEALLRAAEYCPAFVPADDLFRAFLEEHAPLREPRAGST